MDKDASADADATATGDGPLRRRPSRTLTQIAIEVGSIVLGVLLALAVSQWEEDRSNRERAESALGNVRSELADNLSLLETVHARNSALVERLAAGQQVTDEENFVPGLQVADAAWQALSSTGLAGFVDYDLLIELSRLYVIIDVYRRAAYGLVDANFTLMATATALGKRVDDKEMQSLFAENFLAQFTLLVGIESVLIEAHRETLVRLDDGLRQEGRATDTAAPPP